MRRTAHPRVDPPNLSFLSALPVPLSLVLARAIARGRREAGMRAAERTAGEAPSDDASSSARDVIAPIPEDWRGEHGVRLEDEVVRARLVGRPGTPVVAALGGISADRFVAEEDKVSGPGAPRPGWWREVARRGGGIDLDRFQVLGVDFSPLDPKAPVAITPADQARLVALAMDAAGIETLHAFVGASYGGMVALAFARLFPKRVGRLVMISAAHRPHPMATAWRGVQRRILKFGLDAGRPEEGVALARQLAMTTYRTPEEFAGRFKPGIPDAGDDADVCGYLISRGQAYAAVASPARFLSLSAAIDRHLEEPEAITTPTLLIAARTDRLVPLEDMRELHERLKGPSRLIVIDSLVGHDSFLKDADLFAPHLKAWLAEPVDHLGKDTGDAAQT
jgi:homoserine O-acetyltransferase